MDNKRLGQFLERKLAKDEKATLKKEIEVKGLGTLSFKQLPITKYLNTIDDTLTTNSTVDKLEFLKQIIYFSCEELQDAELHQALEVKDPIDVVTSVLSISEINTIGAELQDFNDSLAASVGGELASKVDKSASIAYSPYSSVMTKRAAAAASNNNIAYKKGVSQLLGNVKNAPTFATGTNYFKGGIAEINEHGGEMVVLPSGSKVIPSDKTNDIINNSSSSSRCVINLNIDTFIGNRQFLDNVIQEIDRVIGQKMAIN